MSNAEGNRGQTPEKDQRLKRIKKAAKNAVRITTAGAVFSVGSISNASAEPFHSPTSFDQNQNTLLTNEPMPSQNPGLLQMEGGMANLQSAEAPAVGSAFSDTWNYSDQLVAEGKVDRTWMWGPQPNTPVIQEMYDGKLRNVQYFDKSRMEENPGANPPWNVTNGLLVEEMIKGQIQTGNASFDNHSPANIQIAGDVEPGNGPTYAALAKVLDTRPEGIYQDNTVATTIDANGNTGYDQSFLKYGVKYQEHVDPTNHDVASVFWTYMNSVGPVIENGQEKTDTIMPNPYYETGYPITEPYWTKIKVGGVTKDVLVQAFERRVLTYTPSNEDGWQVEMGNDGSHYSNWRYPNGYEIPGQQLVEDISIPGMDVYSSSDINISLNEASSIADENTLEALMKQYFSGKNFTINVLDNSGDVLKQKGTGYSVSLAGDDTFTGTGIDTSQVMDEKIDVNGNNFTMSINLPQLSSDPTTRKNQEAAVNVWLSKRILLEMYAKVVSQSLPAAYGSTIGPMYRAELFQANY